MKGTDNLYAGLTEKGIAAETFAHALLYYGTEDIKHLHPEIASINNSSGVIDIANFDDRIWKFEAIWNFFCYAKYHLIDHEIFK